MTFSKFQRCIEQNSFPATARGKIVDLLVKAYGLCHVNVLDELKSISNSDFDGIILFFDGANRTPYTMVTWNVFKALLGKLHC